LEGREGDADCELGGVNGAGGLGMVGEFFSDGFRQLWPNVPEKGMSPWKEQAHKTVANENEPGEFE
jgi:hypothetical protein